MGDMREKTTKLRENNGKKGFKIFKKSVVFHDVTPDDSDYIAID